MANKSSGNGYLSFAGQNRMRSPVSSVQSAINRYTGPPLFPIPPPDYYANRVWMEGPTNVHSPRSPQSSDVYQYPMVGVIRTVPPPGFGNQVSERQNVLPDLLVHPCVYSNVNVYNQLVFNNISNMTINYPSLESGTNPAYQGPNVFEGGSQTVPINVDSNDGEIPLPQCTNNTPECALDDEITKHFDDLIKTALDGCKKAVILAGSNQKRPCFKKIDTLCANLQLDLVKPDNVMANINSQGMAWAVKDFIFVFTRIMNAWIIIKGYVYDQPAGLVEIQKELCPNFRNAFSNWHRATHALTESLIESFVKLDELAKMQRAGVNSHVKVKQSDTDKASEERSNDATECCGFPKTDGSYIRTGLYETLKLPVESPQSTTINGHKVTGKTSESDTSESNVQITSKFNSSESTLNETETNSSQLDHPKKPYLDHTVMKNLHGAATAWVIDSLFKQVFAIDESSYFLKSSFTQSYFPDFFLFAYRCSDLQTIFRNAEKGVYSKAENVLYDLLHLVDECKRYMEAYRMGKFFNTHSNKPSKIQEQESKNLSTMECFVEKMEPILREAFWSIALQEKEMAESCYSSDSIKETLVSSCELE